MQRHSWKLWAAAGLSAALLELPFPLAGPMPAWRSVFAWFGLVPLLWAILSPGCREPAKLERPRPLRRAFLLAYLCGVLWYCGNCYWVRDTMLRYGDMPPMAPTLLLLGFSLVLGLYFGLFGLGVMLVRRATGSTRLALVAAPIFWVALELAAARITSVPWDQLGYSQVDNALVNQLAPWTGVYGISFLLVAVNALLAGGLVLDRSSHRRLSGLAGAVLFLAGWAGVLLPPPRPA
ncbi:MAG: apolipoprotein N-acyltransferase, partial [Terracidiphilus sp.]